MTEIALHIVARMADCIRYGVSLTGQDEAGRAEMGWHLPGRLHEPEEPRVFDFAGSQVRRYVSLSDHRSLRSTLETMHD